MATPQRALETGKIYHLYNRGVEKRTVFTDPDEYQHWLKTLVYYQQSAARGRLANNMDFRLEDRTEPHRFHVLAYCLMPNHFHLLVEQLEDDGIRAGASLLSNSYTKAFNTKHNRVGPLFQGRFRSVEIKNDEQLVHVFRYILLNPYVAQLVDDPAHYRWSSWNEHMNPRSVSLCNDQRLRDYFDSPEAFLAFIADHASYARSLYVAKHLLNE